jgi:hypothetical protein
MADGLTPNYDFVKPEVGASDDTWGEKTNANWDKADAAIATATQGPPGTPGAPGPAGPQGPAGPSGSGTGDVLGTTPATVDNLAVYASTDGKSIKDGAKKISDLALVASIPVPATVDPAMDTTPAVLGVSTKYAREDHQHPVDTSRAPTSHSHTASQITDFSEATDDRVAALLVAGTNVTLTYDDTLNKLTVDAAGGGGGGASVTISDTAPSSPMAGNLWWESDTGILYIYYNDGTSSQWVSVSGGNSITSDLYVAKTGDTMTGPLTLQSADPYIVMNKTAGAHANIIQGSAAGFPRWAMLFGNYTLESGSNVGSDWALYRYNDAGAFIDIPIYVERANGYVTIPNGLTVSGNLITEGQAYSPLTTLTVAATLGVWNTSLGQKAKVTLNQAGHTMAAPTNFIEGGTYFLWLIQDGTGGRTITTWNAAFDFGAAGAPTLSTAASKADLMTFEAITIAGTLKLRYTGIAKGFG